VPIAAIAPSAPTMCAAALIALALVIAAVGKSNVVKE